MTVQRMLEGKGKEVATILSNATVAEATRRLSELKIGALIVSDDGRSIAGILSERDIVSHIGRDGPSALERKVGEVMTTKVITCSPGNTTEEVMQAMTKGRFRHMPVVANGVLAGIISIGDVVKRRIADVESEAAELRRFIAS